MHSHSNLVKNFTEESKGIQTPRRPIPMSKESVRFLAKMMISEIVEMLESVESRRDAVSLAHILIDEDNAEKLAMMTSKVEEETKETNDAKIIEAQADAIVDCWYYGLDSAAKHGINLEPIFQLVHGANMAKRNPETGLFERREDGKVIKPNGWTPADVLSEVDRQMKNGGFE
jgi:predicted HAD superfamily Cof-like phosphohydrolase